MMNGQQIIKEFSVWFYEYVCF